MSDIDGIVTVTITANTVSPTRAGFGTPGLVSYFPTSVFPERVRAYSLLTAMVSDGFLVTDPAYLMAVAVKAQNPSPTSWKVCRRALAPVQTLNLTPTVTTAGEVLAITIQGTEIEYTILAGASVATIVTAMTALFNAVVGVTAVDNTTHVTLTPKNVATATLTVDGVVNTETYTVTIDGTAFAFLSDGTATATEIRDGLQALIIAGGYAAAEVLDNAADALDFAFASHAGADLRESATGAATMVLSSEVLANRLLSVGGVSTGLTVVDLTPDPGVATDWAAIIAEDKDFYGVGMDSESEVQIKALAALIEVEQMIYIPNSINTENAVAATTDDVWSDLKALGYDRTGALQATYNSQYQGCRWLGRMLPTDPGSATWAFKKLSGATVGAYSAAQTAALDGKKANYYLTVGGVPITRQGYAVSGEWLDTSRGIDWFSARIQERIYSLLVNNDKVTYAQMQVMAEAEIRAQMEEAQRADFLVKDLEDTPWVVTIPDPADISSAEKILRNYPSMEFSAFLANAVHFAQVVGTLSP